MMKFESILWDVIHEYTSDLKEGYHLSERMKLIGVFDLAHGEYEADEDVAKCKKLLREAMHEALHELKNRK